jgi:hypothetical protein
MNSIKEKFKYVIIMNQIHQCNMNNLFRVQTSKKIQLLWYDS